MIIIKLNFYNLKKILIIIIIKKIYDFKGFFIELIFGKEIFIIFDVLGRE